MSRARPRRQPGARGQCALNVGRPAGNRGNPLDRRWAAAEAMPITHDSEKVFAAVQQTQRFGARRGKDRDPGPIRYVAAAKFTSTGSSIAEPRIGRSRIAFIKIESRRLERRPNPGRYLLPRDTLEAGLSLREVNVGAEAKRRCGSVALSAISIARDIRGCRY